MKTAKIKALCKDAGELIVYRTLGGPNMIGTRRAGYIFCDDMRLEAKGTAVLLGMPAIWIEDKQYDLREMNMREAEIWTPEYGAEEWLRTVMLMDYGGDAVRVLSGEVGGVYLAWEREIQAAEVENGYMEIRAAAGKYGPVLLIYNGMQLAARVLPISDASREYENATTMIQDAARTIDAAQTRDAERQIERTAAMKEADGNGGA